MAHKAYSRFAQGQRKGQAGVGGLLGARSLRQRQHTHQIISPSNISSGGRFMIPHFGGKKRLSKASRLTN